MRTYVAVCEDHDAPAGAKVAAATMLLAYGHGRPIQQVQVLEERTLTLKMPSIADIDAELERRGLKDVLELEPRRIEDMS